MIDEKYIYEKKQLDFYNSIDYYKKLESLSKRYPINDGRLEKLDKKKVLKIFEDLGYTAKYMGKEKFYKIHQDFDEYEGYFHVSLVYGLVELIFGFSKKDIPFSYKSDYHIGGTAAQICSLIKYALNRDIEEYRNPSIRKPCFTNFEELKEILKESLFLYEDMKKEFFKIHS